MKKVWNNKLSVTSELMKYKSYNTKSILEQFIRARYPIWGCSLIKNFGHVRDMVDF